MPIRPTLVDVARRAGVSKATAHRALVYGRRVSEETRRRVEAAAAEVGYRPDPALSMLARQRWQITGPAKSLTLAIVHNHPPDLPNIPESLFRQIEFAARAEGFDIEVYNRHHFPNGLALTKHLVNSRVSGVLLPGIKYDQPPLDLNWDEFCAVNVTTGIFSPSVPTVRNDYFATTLAVLEKIWARGYRRIGALFHREDQPAPDDERRYAALHYFQLKHAHEAEALPPCDCPFEDAASSVAWFRKHQPDAVFGFSAADYYALAEAGIDMESVGFAGLIIQPHTPHLAGLRNCFPEICLAAIRKLDAMLRFNDRGLRERPEQVVLEAAWQEGSSLPDKNHLRR